MHSENEVVYLYLDDIIPNRFQPREVFDEKALKELAVSIKEHGVIQPIIVRSIGQKYEIIAGERRYKASALAGLTKIPAIVRNLDDKESSKVALLENLQRKNLNPIEEARTYQKILELDQMTQDQLAKTMGKSQSAVANKLRLLSLTDEVQDALLREQISERHARSLITIKDSNEQKEMLKKIINQKLTVRELETEIKGNDPEVETSDPIDINTVSMPTALDDLIKVNHSDIERPKSDYSAAPIDFVNSDPIKPNVEGLEKDKNLGKIEIKPPEGSNMENQDNTPTFINYGEIDEDDLNDDEDDGFGPRSFTDTTVDLDQIKSTAVDINPPMNEDINGATPDALDNLLNIKPTPRREELENQNSGNKFFNESQEVKRKETSPERSLEDLFKAPDIIPINQQSEDQKEDNINNNILDYNSIDDELPMVSINDPKDTQLEANSNSVLTGNKNGLENAVTTIQRTLNDLKTQGFDVEFDEMELKNSYQMVIKISKDEK